MSTLDEQNFPFEQTEEEGMIEAAQCGCRVSLNRLMETYEPRIGALIADHGSGGMDEDESAAGGAGSAVASDLGLSARQSRTIMEPELGDGGSLLRDLLSRANGRNGVVVGRVGE